MTSEKSLELIARYIVAARDVIDVCGAEAIDPLRVLLKAAHEEAVRGMTSPTPGLQAGDAHLTGPLGENGIRLN